MKKVTSNKLFLFCILFFAVNFGVKSQNDRLPVPVSYVFSADSLSGFDEYTAKLGAFGAGAFGDEYKVYMYAAKRNFIDAKYNLIKPVKHVQYLAPYSNTSSNAKAGPSTIMAANCQNEDYEEATSVMGYPVPSNQPVTSSTGVNGWTIYGGSNSTWSSTGNCTNTAASIVGAPNPVTLIAPGSAGYTDAIIGSSYKIWSVFGPTTTTYPAATTANGFQCYGDWFIRLNDQNPLSSVQRMVKCIQVTSSNALFQFAFISVLQTGHCCCDNGSFRLIVSDGGPGSVCGSPTVAFTPTSCPSFTAASNSSTVAGQCNTAPGGAGAVCTATGTGAPNPTTYVTLSSGWAYNKWKLNTLDLTAFIGHAVRLEVIAMDCPYSGHAGYVYFDAQCSPMDIGGNTNVYPAGTPSISLPTCGAGSTATITAPPVTGGYTWTPPIGCSSSCYTVTGVGLTNQQIATNITGNFTLTMNPPGSCSPIVRVINVIIAPAPNLAITSNTMYSCSQNTLNGVTLQMSSGTATNNPTIPQYNVTFAPAQPTGTLGVTANTGTYTGLSVGINTITIADSVGCIATQTINVLPAPQIPTLNIVASNLVVGCAPPTVTIGVVNTNTALTNMTYTWSSITTTGTAVAPGNQVIDVGAPSGTNTLTVSGSDPSSGCIATASCVLTASTSAPSFTITPVLTQSIGCNQPCKTFTAIASTTTNVFGTWYDVTTSTVVPLVGPSGGTVVLCAGTPGTYAMTFTNMITGCTTTQTVSVTSNTSVPTITVTSVLGGFQLNCTKPCLPLNINSSVASGPTSYTWTNLTTNVSTFPPTGGFTVCTTGANVPGQYVASVKDGFGCTVSTTITISIDTLRPAPTSTATLPSLAPDSYTINCFTPSIVATGISNPLYPAANYSWTVPPNLIMSSQTVTVSMVNIPSSTSPTNYTVLAMNPNNGCVGRKLVKFYKDIFVPPYTTVYTPSAITCANPCVAFSPKNSVTSNTMPITYTFTSPPPTQTATTLGALMCVPGPYTMTYMNALNGCTAQATTTVQLNTTPPATFALAPVHINCGATTTTLIAGHTGSATAGTYSYTWDGPPLAGMSCPGGMNCYSTTANMAGDYQVVILNTVNGCVATNSVTVLDNGGILSGVTFTANPSTGFSPLDVNFDNTTILTNTSTGVVSTTWNYGNGISMTYTGSSNTYSLTGPDGSSTYQSAGNYTVYLIVSQVTGTNTCIGTATAVVSVDLPSKMDVPNVFTPNKDGVNDVFMLQTTNLTEITCTIFDRWGVKMYDVKADKGNIEWDGKNFSNKDVPAGTYFYILKAKGKDEKDYEQKGTISLYR